jgi:hypothetical protein
MLNKIIIKIGLPLLIIIGFTACGGGDSASFTQASVVLNINESRTVKKGDSITPLTDDTQITVEHIINTEDKIVTVKSGSIELIFGDYEINEG